MQERTPPSRLQRLILAALQPQWLRAPDGGRRGVLRPDRPLKHVYMNTVADDVVARRRARNKVARRSRRVNRLRAR